MGKSYSSEDKRYDAVVILWGKCWTDQFTSCIRVFYLGLSLVVGTFMENVLMLLVKIVWVPGGLSQI